MGTSARPSQVKVPPAQVEVRMRSFAWSVPVILLLVILLLGLFTSLLEMKAETLIPHRGVGSEI